MKILIVGSGGREHAIAASVAKVPEQIRYTARPETRELQNTQSAWTSEQWNLKNWQNLPKKRDRSLHRRNG